MIKVSIWIFCGFHKRKVYSFKNYEKIMYSLYFFQFYKHIRIHSNHILEIYSIHIILKQCCFWKQMKHLRNFWDLELFCVIHQYNANICLQFSAQQGFILFLKTVKFYFKIIKILLYLTQPHNWNRIVYNITTFSNFSPLTSIYYLFIYIEDSYN